jgi:hypothetical protein
VTNPTTPVPCRPAVLSVIVCSHVDGSVVPAGQARYRSVVGDEPVA